MIVNGNIDNEDRDVINRINRMSFRGLEKLKCGDVLFVSISNMKKSSVIKCLITAITCSLLDRVSIQKIGNNNNISFLFSNSYSNRMDHYDLIRRVWDLCEDKVLFLPGRKICIRNIIHLRKFFGWIRTIHKSFCIKLSCNYALQLYLAYLDAKEIINYIIKERISSILVFCDTHIVDSLVVQMCNAQNVVTGTLQHGYYVFHSPSFVYSHSNYFLCFGQSTLDNADCYSKNVLQKYFKLGMPHLIGETVNNTLYVKNNKVCIIILSDDIEEEEDALKCTEFLTNDRGYKRIIKLHPGQSVDAYSYSWLPSDEIITNEKNIKELTDEADFAIIPSGSTVFIEYLVRLFPVFIYENMKQRFPGVEWCKFCSSEGLIELLDILNNKPDLFESKMIATRSYYTEVQNVDKNYKDFLTRYMINAGKANE